MSEIEFPLSRVVKGIKKHTGDKQISIKVKIATEQLLQEVTEIVSKDLDKVTRDKKTIGEEDLLGCTRPFQSAIHMDQEHDEMVQALERIKNRMGTLVKEFRQKFDMNSEKQGFYFKPTGKLAAEEKN